MAVKYITLWLSKTTFDYNFEEKNQLWNQQQQ